MANTCPFSMVVSGSQRRELRTDIFVEPKRIGDPAGPGEPGCRGADVSMIWSGRWVLARQAAEPLRPGAVNSQGSCQLVRETAASSELGLPPANHANARYAAWSDATRRQRTGTNSASARADSRELRRQVALIHPVIVRAG